MPRGWCRARPASTIWSFEGNPDILITSVGAGNVATLSMPLPEPCRPVRTRAQRCWYAPFGPPELSNGEPNPAFQATLQGWLSYVATVSKEAASIFGPEGYDLEVWNELGFGSQFLEEKNYYSPVRETETGSVTETLLDETVAYVRNPANGISPGVGITDGFASETPFASGALVPSGTTALSKHLYNNGEIFPIFEKPESIKPVNALGQPDYTTGGTKTKPIYTPLFTPTYMTLQPEYYLTATQTESVVRDIAPITTKIFGAPHGRNVGPPGGEPVQTWMTEYNITTNILHPISPAHPDAYAGPAVNAAQAARLQAEILLRSLVSMVNKGMTREYFYAAADTEGFNLIGESFMSAVNKSPSAYPGDQLGGETTEGFKHMLEQFQGPGPSGAARQLELLSIAQEGTTPSSRATAPKHIPTYTTATCWPYCRFSRRRHDS